MKHRYAKYLAVLAGAIGAGAAGANPVVHGAPQQAPTPHPATASMLSVTKGDHLVEHGDRIESVASISAGVADDAPLGEAIKALLPVGWRGSLAPDVDASLAVSWGDGLSWIDALHEVAQDNGLRVSVGWARKIVLIDPLIEWSAPAAPGSAQMAEGQPTAPGSHAAPRDSDTGHVHTPRDPEVSMSASTGWVSDEQQAVDAAPLAQPAQPKAVAHPANVVPGEGAAQAIASPQDFIFGDVALDETDISLASALAKCLPPDWSVDFRVDDLSVMAARLDVTYAGPRAQFLDAIGSRQGLSLLPYVPFKKLIVAKGK